MATHIRKFIIYLLLVFVVNDRRDSFSRLCMLTSDILREALVTLLGATLFSQTAQAVSIYWGTHRKSRIQNKQIIYNKGNYNLYNLWMAESQIYYNTLNSIIFIPEVLKIHFAKLKYVIESLSKK